VERSGYKVRLVERKVPQSAARPGVSTTTRAAAKRAEIKRRYTGNGPSLHGLRFGSVT